MNITNYKRNLSEAERNFWARRLQENNEARLLIDFFAQEGSTESTFEVTQGSQLVSEHQAGINMEVSLGRDSFIWYSTFNHTQNLSTAEDVTGVVIKGNQEQLYHVKEGQVLLFKESTIHNLNTESGIVTPQDNCLIYGNWCGPGCSGPSDPIDGVDSCCKTHDLCYDRNGYFDCECDAALIRCLDNQSGFWAWTIRTYFLAQAGFNRCSEIIE